MPVALQFVLFGPAGKTQLPSRSGPTPLRPPCQTRMLAFLPASTAASEALRSYVL